MNVNGVTQSTATNTNYNSTVGSNNATTEQEKPNDTAATIEISAEGKQQAQLYHSDDHPNLFESYREKMDQMKSELKGTRSESSSQIWIYSQGSIGEAIHGFLSGGKMDGSAIIAGELGAMLEGVQSNPNGTVEERAVNRELALRSAEHIAKNYITDPNEAEAFMKLVKEAADNDILREKGYLVDERNPSDEPLRSYETDVGLYNAYVSKNTGLSNANQFNSTHPKWQEVNDSYSAHIKKDNGATIQAEAAKDFEENEANVADKIKGAVEQIPETALNDNLLKLLKLLTTFGTSNVFGNTASNPNDLSYLFAGLSNKD